MPQSTFAPTSEAELESIVRDAIAAKTPLEVTGRNTKAVLGRPVQAAATISLSGFSGIASYEPEELVGKTLVAIVNLPPRKMMGIDSCGMLLSAIHEEEDAEKLNLIMVDNRIPAGARLH